MFRSAIGGSVRLQSHSRLLSQVQDHNKRDYQVDRWYRAMRSGKKYWRQEKGDGEVGNLSWKFLESGEAMPGWGCSATLGWSI